MQLGLGLGVTRQQGGYSPLSLFAASEQGAWYDPSDLSTLFQDSAGTTPVTAAGQPVGLMRDKSGRANHATQTTAASRPTYQTSGGLHWLVFDGVDDFLVTPTITPGTDKVQVFAGVRKSSDAASGIAVELGTDSAAQNGSFGLFAPSVSGANSYRFLSRGTVTKDAGTGVFAAAPDTAVVTVIGDISGPLASLRRNGSVVTSTATDQGTGNYLAYPVYIGRRGGTALQFNGNVYGMTMRFGPNLSAAQIAQAEAYMAGKTGVTL